MRKVLVAAGVVSMVSMSMAQHLEVGVDGGYGLGVGTALVGDNMTFDQNFKPTQYDEVYASRGAGLKLGGEVVYFFNENMGIMVASGYSMLGKYSTEKKEPGDTTQSTTTSRYLPINLGLKFKAKMGIVEPYLYVAPGIYFPKQINTLISTSGPDTFKTTYSYALGWGVSSGIGAVIRVSEKVGIKLEITPTYAFAKQSQFVVEHKGQKMTTIFKEDTAQLPASTSDTQYQSDAPRDSYSSVAVRAGVCFKIF
jgi:hypothetical protein